MKKTAKRDVSFDLARDIRNPNVVIEVSKSTAMRQHIKPGLYTGRQLREVTK